VAGALHPRRSNSARAATPSGYDPNVSRDSRLDELRAEYERLVNSMEYAYAMGHSITLGRDPRLEHVVERVGELRREIAALKDEEDR
jgi:hypothetical protein